MALANHQVDHLFLLVGGNPLPNYVAAKTLLKENGIPYFVYTSRTEEYAKALRDCLGANNQSMVFLEKGRETDAFHIREKITSKLQEILKKASPETRQIGLNYTGGKKVMSVHAYEAIKAKCPDAVFSYLDPDGIKMVIEQGESRSLEEKLLTPAIRKCVGITFDTFWKLHAIELHPDLPAHNVPILPDVAKVIAKTYANGNRKEWDDWTNTLSKTREITSCPCQAIVDAFQRYDPSFNTVQDIGNKDFNQKVGQALDWLRGGHWLEDYTLDSLQNISSDLATDAQLCSVQTFKKGQKKTDNKFFEVDVIALRGYQLFVITCTKSQDKDICKEKIFEARLRAQQLGGDEARFALVCGYSDSEMLKREMQGLMNPDIFEVFDVHMLGNLSVHLQNWIKRVDREAQ